MPLKHPNSPDTTQGSRRFGCCGKLLFWLVLLAMLAASLIILLGLQDHPTHAGVAVVLGNEVYKDGTPSPRLAARLDKALELYAKGQCRTIITSGGTGESGVDEAGAMARYLHLRGVPQHAVVQDPDGVNSWETARFTAAYLREHGQDSVIVVSQYFHIPRCWLALRFSGVKTVGTASPWYFELRDLFSIAREIPAILSYTWKYSSMDAWLRICGG